MLCGPRVILRFYVSPDMDEETEEYVSTEEYEEDEKSEDPVLHEDANLPIVLMRLNSNIDYTAHSTLQLAKFHIDQLSYVMPIATHGGLLEMRMITHLCYGFLGVSNCKYPSAVTLDPYISYGGDLGLLASATGAWSKLDEFRFLQRVAAVGVRKIPLHQDSDAFGRLSVEDRHLRAVTDARGSVVPLSARAAFASLRRRATGLCEAEIYINDFDLRRVVIVPIRQKRARRESDVRNQGMGEGACASSYDMSLTSAGASSAAALILEAPGQYPPPLAIENGTDLVELVFTCMTADARQSSRNAAAVEQQRIINAAAIEQQRMRRVESSGTRAAGTVARSRY